MKQQTAVEWLVSELRKPYADEFINKIIEQAKAMEKEQIQDAFYYGVDVDSCNVENSYVEAEEYYQKTYAK